MPPTVKVVKAAHVSGSPPAASTLYCAATPSVGTLCTSLTRVTGDLLFLQYFQSQQNSNDNVRFILHRHKHIQGLCIDVINSQHNALR